MRRAAESISATVEKIDIVINNAAIMACPWSKTEDGIESQFATNYLGHFLLTNLLLDNKTVKMDGARIINTTSTGGLAGEVAFDDVNFQVFPWSHLLAMQSVSNEIYRTVKRMFPLRRTRSPKLR